jgi:hypothetical protein
MKKNSLRSSRLRGSVVTLLHRAKTIEPPRRQGREVTLSINNPAAPLGGISASLQQAAGNTQV